MMLLAAPAIDIDQRVPERASLGLIAITLVMTVGVMYATWYERKIVARMQMRLGPTRTGPFGLLQSIADAIKLLAKEDLRPATADFVAFELAVFAIFVPAFLAFVAVPFTEDWVVSALAAGPALHPRGLGPLVHRLPDGGLGLATTSTRCSAACARRRSSSRYEIPLILALVGVVMVDGIARPVPDHPVPGHGAAHRLAAAGFLIFLIGVDRRARAAAVRHPDG